MTPTGTVGVDSRPVQVRHVKAVRPKVFLVFRFVFLAHLVFGQRWERETA